MSDQAPGHPGIPPRWTSSAKSGVGTAATPESRVWFTVSHGIVNEVYYPTIDQANTRDLGLLVTDGSEFFAEEKRHTVSEIEPMGHGVPGYRITSTCREGRYSISKTIIRRTDRRPFSTRLHRGVSTKSVDLPVNRKVKRPD